MFVLLAASGHSGHAYLLTWRTVTGGVVCRTANVLEL